MDKQEDHKKTGSGGNIFNRIIFKQTTEDVASGKEKVPWNTPTSSDRRLDVSFEDVTSSRMDKDPFANSEEYVRDHNSLLSLQPWIFKKGNFYRDEDLMSSLNSEFSDQCNQGMNVFMDKSPSMMSPPSVTIGFGNRRTHNSLRRRRAHIFSVKPLSSEENWLIPRLYKNGLEFEEYVFCSSSAPHAPTLRPFVITDGQRIISKSSYESVPTSLNSGKQKQVDEITSGNKENVAGMSPLPKLVTPKLKSRDSPCKKLDTSNTRRSFKSPHSKDLYDGLHIFSIGVSIGVIYTILVNRGEVDKLNDMLMSTKNLVQDLQDELEMKESFTVKELYNVAHKNHESDAVIGTAESPAESTIDQITTYYYPTNQNDEATSQQLPKIESMSKIEAELEAELEKLELNINASSLDGRMSRLSELDPDLIVDVTHGELRANMLANGTCEDQDDHASDNTSTSTNHEHNGNYAVSPHELSLRLHEVIQSRLEERIKDLEQALQQSQRQLQLMQIEDLHSHRAFSSSDVESSSNQESPTALAMENLGQPFCISLSGDALNAYNEAYEEFTRFTIAEDTPPSTTKFSDNLGNVLHSSDWSLIWGMEGKRYRDKEQPPLEEIFWSKGSDGHNDNHITSEDEYEDKEEKMLIQQILERTRQGSPLVLHAQRLLFSMDE